MTRLGTMTFRTRRAALAALLLAAPLLPLVGCNDGGDGRDGGGTEVENGDTREDEDENEDKVPY